ncbi:hypothetical protein [Chryseolinea lacunae]|uniref:Uncharacterized protein n=1 Tax=Chryseolinea lacunae TaxID=2801331 RepID=A0ABS1KZ02_9BACT|nr:hypothetical protein [Chryseolinea lacunae]MBL0744403.1 hypothetical protein [Chryseolinea lacunae]
MKKLEDIPKKEVFEVPDGYFDKLPGIIHARVSKPGAAMATPGWAYGLRYALPAVVLFAAGIFWYTRPGTDLSPEGLLAAVQTEELVAYLNDTDVSTDELLEDAQLDGIDASEIEGDVYGLNIPDDDLTIILDDID